MSTRSSSEPSLYVVYIILNVVSDFGTSVMFILVACFCRTSLMKVRRTLEKLLRWRAKWINMGQRVKTEIQSKLSEWKLSWVANWQILRGNGFCPMRRVRRKHFLKEQPRSLALKKMSSVYSEDTWQLWQHGNSLDWSWQRTPRPVQLEWLPYDWETNGPDARNTEISACKDQCWGVDTCWLQKGKKLDGNLNSALNFLQFSEVHVFWNKETG